MKKATILIIFAFVFFFKMALAVEGTCSWHGGVDCSAGSDWDGSAICNDGWKDSSENYYSNTKCQDTLPQCPRPLVFGYTNMSQCNALQNICDKTNASRQQTCNVSGITNPEYCELVSCSDFDYCKKQVDTYNASVQSYNECLDIREEYMKLQIKKAELQTKEAQQFIDSYNFKYPILTNSDCKTKDKNSHLYYGECACDGGFELNFQKQCAQKSKPIKYISANAEKYGNLNDCSNVVLSDTEKQQCKEYRALGYSYDYQVYPDVQINPPSSLPVSSKDNTKEKPLNNVKNIEQQNKPKLIKTYSSYSSMTSSSKSSLLDSSISSSTTFSSTSSVFFYQKNSNSTSSSLIANVEKSKTKRSIYSFFRKWFKGL